MFTGNKTPLEGVQCERYNSVLCNVCVQWRILCTETVKTYLNLYSAPQSKFQFSTPLCTFKCGRAGGDRQQDIIVAVSDQYQTIQV